MGLPSTPPSTPRGADATDLLERETAFESLRAQVAMLAAGHGGCALVEGEAGIGKTSLLRALRVDTAARADWLLGTCEPLLAPPPLAPWMDMLSGLPPRLADAVRHARVGAALFADLLSLMQHAPRPLVMAVEDVHWADGATLDLLRFLGRRIADTPVLLVLTWRDNEIGPDHPLRTVLAGMDPACTRRHVLRPLSAAAVNELAQRVGRDGRGLHAASGGNPFFLRQLLAAPPGEALPAQVRDALLVRVARLPAHVRDVLEAVSLSPVPLEIDVLQAAIAPDPDAVKAALLSGLLVHEGESLRLVHELARAALAESVGTRAAGLHAALFDALGQRAESLARLVHHAEHAGLAHAVVRLAPRAADQAAAAHAHRQAAALAALVLSHRTLLSPADELAMASAHAMACLRTNQLDAAAASRCRAVELARILRDPVAEAEQLRQLARVEWGRGATTAGIHHARAAARLLRRHAPASRELAMAYSVLAQLHLLDTKPRLTRHWCALALDSFTALGDVEGRADALNTSGSARLGTAEQAEGLIMLQRALALARGHEFADIAARAWTNLVSAALVDRRWDNLDRLCADAMAYCEPRDLHTFGFHIDIRRAWADIERGRWLDGRRRLQTARAHADLNPLQREQIEHLLAVLALRRGEAGAAAYGQRLRRGEGVLGVEPWYFSLPLHRAEAAWLAGDLEAAAALAARALGDPRPPDDIAHRGMLQLWLHRAGHPVAEPALWPAGAALELGGHIEDAAQSWADLGSPYEQAMVLSFGDEGQMRRALVLLRELGAQGTYRAVRRRLRGSGAAGVPRGPYGGTRRDPRGLSPRERQVLDLLAQGLSNRDIAERLHRSERTVEHHVAALIGKLGASDRHDAVRRGREN